MYTHIYYQLSLTIRLGPQTCSKCYDVLGTYIIYFIIYNIIVIVIIVIYYYLLYLYATRVGSRVALYLWCRRDYADGTFEILNI